MNIERIDLNLLVYHDVLLRERNVTRAASYLGITQPAMSNGLRRLRELFDDPLLVRTSEGMTPTERVTRRLVGLYLDQPVRENAQVLVEGKPAGEISSQTISPRFGAIALAVLKRPNHEPGTEVVIQHGDQIIRAVVSLDCHLQRPGKTYDNHLLHSGRFEGSNF